MISRSLFSKILLLLALFSVNFSFCMQKGADDNGVFFVKRENEVKFIIEKETGDISDILKYIKDGESSDIIVIFDLDGVVMIPKEDNGIDGCENSKVLGCDAWAYYEGDKYIAKYNNGTVKGASKEAFSKGLEEFHPVWSFVQKHVNVKLVDKKLPEVIRGLEKSFVKIMGFTARGMDLVNRTKEQMDSIGVDFSENAYCSESIKTNEYVNENGILFINLGVSKGEILKKFFDKIGKKPCKIVFIDDQQKNINTIKDMCEKENISFVGIKYSAKDAILRLDDKQKKICDIQLEHLNKFGVILSDEVAEKEMQKNIL